MKYTKFVNGNIIARDGLFITMGCSAKALFNGTDYPNPETFEKFTIPDNDENNTYEVHEGDLVIDKNTNSTITKPYFTYITNGVAAREENGDIWCLHYNEIVGCYNDFIKVHNRLNEIYKSTHNIDDVLRKIIFSGLMSEMEFFYTDILMMAIYTNKECFDRFIDGRKLTMSEIHKKICNIYMNKINDVKRSFKDYLNIDLTFSPILTSYYGDLRNDVIHRFGKKKLFGETNELTNDMINSLFSESHKMITEVYDQVINAIGIKTE